MPVEGDFKWTKEACIKDAKRFENQADWRLSSPLTFYAASRNKWLVSCQEHMVRKKKWAKEACIVEAQKYKTIGAWTKNSIGSYNAARTNGWRAEATAHMSRKSNPNTKQKSDAK